MNLINKSISCLLILLFSLQINAQVLPKNVDLQELGLSFTTPSGWTAQAQDVFIIMGHESIPGLMILTVNESKTTSELKSLAMQGLHDQNINLQAMGDFSILGRDRVEGYFEGNFEGALVKCFAIGLINGLGHGMNIYILTEKGKFGQQHVQEAKKLAASVKFFQKKDSQATVNWKEKLSNKTLSYKSSSSSSDYGGGYSHMSTTENINLCPNGTFTYYYSDQNSAQAGDGFGGVDGSAYGNLTDSNEGQFIIYTAVEGSYLELTFNGGKIKSYKLSTNAEGNLILNGSRYFRSVNESCY